MSADTKYPTLGGAFQLTCTLDMGEEGWRSRVHRHSRISGGLDCGKCDPPSYNGETGVCTDRTSATYNVQCTVEGTAITMVFDVTGVNLNDIGRWECAPTMGSQPGVDISITELGKACSVHISTVSQVYKPQITRTRSRTSILDST